MIQQILLEETNTILKYNKIENIRIIQSTAGHALIASTYSPVGYLIKPNGYDTQIMNYVLYTGSLEQCKEVIEFIFTTNKEKIRLPSDALLNVEDNTITV